MTSEETKRLFPQWVHNELLARRQLIANIMMSMTDVAVMNGMTVALDKDSEDKLSSVDHIQSMARHGTSDGSRFDTAREFGNAVSGKLEMSGPAGRVYEQYFTIFVTNKKSYPNGQLHATVKFDSDDGYVAHVVTRGRRFTRTVRHNLVCQKLVGKNLDTRNLFSGGGVTQAMREVAAGMTKKLGLESASESVAARMQALIGCENPVTFDGKGADTVYRANYGHMPVGDRVKHTFEDNYTKCITFKLDQTGRVKVSNLNYLGFTDEEFVRLSTLLRDVMDRRQAEETIRGL